MRRVWQTRAHAAPSMDSARARVRAATAEAAASVPEQVLTVAMGAWASVKGAKWLRRVGSQGAGLSWKGQIGKPIAATPVNPVGVMTPSSPKAQPVAAIAEPFGRRAVDGRGSAPAIPAFTTALTTAALGLVWVARAMARLAAALALPTPATRMENVGESWMAVAEGRAAGTDGI